MIENSTIPALLFRPQNILKIVIAILLITSFISAHAQYRYTGAVGMPNYIFDNPVGVAVDNANDWLYVANYGDDQILGFDISDRQYIFAIGNTGSGAGEFVQPTGLAIDDSGNLYVSEFGNGGRIQKFLPGGEVDVSFNFGFPISGLNGPHGIAIDNTNDRLYVAESGAHRIAVYSRSGTLRGYLTTASLGTAALGTTLSNPLGVGVHADGTLYIANTGSGNVLRVPYNASVGSMTANHQQSVSSPYHITINSANNRLFVTNINSHNVVILNISANLTPITTIGSSGSGASQFSRPSGIAIDASQNIYVAEFDNNRIQSFSSTNAWNWTLLTTVTFNGAAGVAINENSGQVYVCDYNNHRVQVFSRATGALTSIFSGTGANSLYYPVGVAVGPAPNYFVYVTEASPTNPYTPYRIQVFNSSGIYTGYSRTDFTAPYQVAVGTDGRVYVADRVGGAVRVFNEDLSVNHFNISVGTETRGVAIDDVNGRIYAINNNGANTNVQVYLKANGLPDLSTGGGDGVLGDDVGEADHSATLSNLAYYNGEIFITQTASSVIYKINAVTGALVQIYGSPGTAIMQFTNPVGIDVASDGQIIVGDFNNHRVQAFTSTFGYSWANGLMATGNANGALSRPTDVSFSNNGRVYIADRNNHRVQVFNPTGGYRAKIDNGAGGADNQLLNPSGVFADGTRLYITDTGNHRIQIFDISSPTETDNPVALTRFGSMGSGANQFLNPAGIWVDANSIYVADQSNNRIQVFNKTTFARTLEITNAQLNQPADVAVDPSGNIFVASRGNSRLVIFNSAGTLLTAIEGPAAGNTFAAPEGLFVDANGVVYVSDTQNNRIVAFSLCGGTDWATNWRAHWIHNTAFGFGTSGQAGAQFNNPVGIGMDPTTYRMIVADRGNQRAQIFVPLPYIVIRSACTNIADGTGSYTISAGGVANDAASLPYDGVSQATFTIENLGNAQLTLNSTPRITMSGTGATSYYISQGSLNGAGNTFNPQVSRTFIVRFRPLSPGPKAVTLTIATNEEASTGRNSYTFNMSGTPLPIASYTYTWTNAAADGNFQNPSNWLLQQDGFSGRTQPKKWDILLFNGGTETITNVPSDTVGAIVLSSNAKISLVPSAPGNVLAIKGRNGTDLQLPSGHELNIESDTPMEIHMVQVGGVLNGSITLDNATSGNPAHRFVAKTLPVTFGNSAAFYPKSISGNPFGADVGNNLIVFASGSTFFSLSGGSPFALSAPNSKVSFESGSTYSHQQAAIPEINNRTYGTFEFDFSGTLDINTAGTGGSFLNDLVIKQGIFRISNDLPITINGNLDVRNTASFEYLPTTANTQLTLGGASSTTFGGAGTITLNSNTHLRVVKSVSSSEVSLTSDLSIPGTVSCISGDINLNSRNLSLGISGSVNEDLINGHIIKDNSASFDYIVSGCVPGAAGPCVTGTIGGTVSASSRHVNGTATNIAGLGLYLSEAEPAGYDATITRYHYSADQKSIRRVYSVLSAPNPTNTTLEIRYADENIPTSPILISEGDFSLYHRLHGAGRQGWENAGISSRNATTNSVILTGVNSFSDWTVGGEEATEVLPIELINFNAVLENSNTALLSWETATELNNDGFAIERSFNGEDFIRIGFLKGKGTTSERSAYAFRDSNLGERNYYRLKQYDTDGAFSYSNIRLVQSESLQERGLVVWPNPFSESVELQWVGGASDLSMTLHLFTANSQLLGTFQGTAQQLSEALNQNLQGMVPGLYILNVLTSQSVYSLKLIKK